MNSRCVKINVTVTFNSQNPMTNFVNPQLTVDNVLFTVHENQLKVLVVKRSIEPFVGAWCLPGGFIDCAVDQSTEDAALRKLREKSGVEPNYLEQLATFSGHHRDPRGFSVTIVYFALIGYQQASTQIDTVTDAEWIAVEALANIGLAFDHKDIIDVALERLKQKTLYSMLPVFCLPQYFTISDLKGVIETIIQKPVQRKSLMRRVEASNMFEMMDEKAITGKRQAQLYRLKGDVDLVHFERNLSQ